MNVLLTQTISAWGWLTPLAARSSDGEDTIWMQILVLVILAVSIGIFSLVKAKTNKFKGHDHDYFQDVHTRRSQRHRHQQTQPLTGRNAHRELSFSARTDGPNINEHKKFAGKASKELTKKREKDLYSGMELLEPDFLLSIVENTNGGDDEKDVAIRKLNFKELLRRGKLNQADSNAIKIYAINKGNLYGKDIQYEAMKNLAERTAKGKTGN